jgi:hypothetical protein
MIDNLGVSQETICAAVLNPATWAFDVISAENYDVSVAGGTLNVSQVDKTLEASAVFLAIVFGGEEALFQIKAAWSGAEPPANATFVHITVDRSPTKSETLWSDSVYPSGDATTTTPAGPCCPYAVMVSFTSSPAASETDTEANGTVTFTFEEV